MRARMRDGYSIVLTALLLGTGHNLGKGQEILLMEWPLQTTFGRSRIKAVAQSKTESGFDPARLLRNISRTKRHMDSTELVVHGRPSSGCCRYER